MKITPATTRAACAADRIRTWRSTPGMRSSSSSRRQWSSFRGMGVFGILSRIPLGWRMPRLWGMRWAAPPMVVGSVEVSSSIISVQVTPCGISESKGISNSSVKMWVRSLKSSTNSTAPWASSSKHRTISVIISIIMTLSVKRAAALVVSVWAVIVRTFTAFWAPVK